MHPSTLSVWATLLLLGGCMPQGGLDPEVRAAATEVSDADLLVARAQAFASVGDYTRAEQYFNAALGVGANESEILPFLLRVCVQDKRYRAATLYVEYHLRRHPEANGVRYVLANLYLGLGDIPRARTELERVVTVEPEHAHAHYTLAVLYRDDIGNVSLADEHFKRYLKLAPEGDHAEEARGSLLRTVQ